MNIDELRKALQELEAGIADSINGVEISATKAQEKIYKYLKTLVQSLDTQDGRFVVDQDYSAKLLKAKQYMQKILGDIYLPAIFEYLSHYTTVDSANISLQGTYNNIDVPRETLSPARAAFYEQAKYYLTKGLADAYIQPAIYLLMQQVTTGITIKDSLRILDNWNKGNVTASKNDLASGKPTPNLQKYATQIARDTAYQYNGAVNDIIANKYELNRFVYVGNLIKDSRPLCVHLVGLRRKIELDEVPKLIETYPEGVIPGTTKKNWYQRRGGYACRHTAFAVK